MTNPTTTGTGEIQWSLQDATSAMGLSVLDNDGDATSVLDDSEPFKVHVKWEIASIPIAEILGGSFRLRAFAESVGPGDEKQIGATLIVPVSPGSTSYEADLEVSAGTLKGEGATSPAESGLYRIAAVLQHLNGVATQVCGYAEGPLVQIRTP